MRNQLASILAFVLLLIGGCPHPSSPQSRSETIPTNIPKLATIRIVLGDVYRATTDTKAIDCITEEVWNNRYAANITLTVTVYFDGSLIRDQYGRITGCDLFMGTFELDKEKLSNLCLYADSQYYQRNAEVRGFYQTLLASMDTSQLEGD